VTDCPARKPENKEKLDFCSVNRTRFKSKAFSQSQLEEVESYKSRAEKSIRKRNSIWGRLLLEKWKLRTNQETLSGEIGLRRGPMTRDYPLRPSRSERRTEAGFMSGPDTYY
jgi:hypothetical protein